VPEIMRFCSISGEDCDANRFVAMEFPTSPWVVYGRQYGDRRAPSLAPLISANCVGPQRAMLIEHVSTYERNEGASRSHGHCPPRHVGTLIRAR
jgi:hypothetical protein